MLPLEPLCEVFSYLTPTEAVQCARVCQWWRALLRGDARVRRQIIFNVFPLMQQKRSTPEYPDDGGGQWDWNGCWGCRGHGYVSGWRRELLHDIDNVARGRKRLLYTVLHTRNVPLMEFVGMDRNFRWTKALVKSFMLHAAPFAGMVPMMRWLLRQAFPEGLRADCMLRTAMESRQKATIFWLFDAGCRIPRLHNAYSKHWPVDATPQWIAENKKIPYDVRGWLREYCDAKGIGLPSLVE
jgi:hypothetical protein